MRTRSVMLPLSPNAVHKCLRVRSGGVYWAVQDSERLELFVTGLPACGGHVSGLRAAGVVAVDEAPIAQCLCGVGFLGWVERRVEFEQERVSGRRIAQISLPAADAGADRKS